MSGCEPGSLPSDIVDDLEGDHRTIHRLLDQLEGAGDHRAAANHLAVLLERHEDAEDAYVYPAVRKLVPGGRKLIVPRNPEHDEIRRLLPRLRNDKAPIADLTRSLDLLKPLVLSHAMSEEAVMFSALRLYVPAEERIRMAADYRVAVGRGMGLQEL